MEWPEVSGGLGRGGGGSVTGSPTEHTGEATPTLGLLERRGQTHARKRHSETTRLGLPVSPPRPGPAVCGGDAQRTLFPAVSFPRSPRRTICAPGCGQPDCCGCPPFWKLPTPSTSAGHQSQATAPPERRRHGSRGSRCPCPVRQGDSRCRRSQASAPAACTGHLAAPCVSLGRNSPLLSSHEAEPLLREADGRGGPKSRRLQALPPSGSKGSAARPRVEPARILPHSLPGRVMCGQRCFSEPQCPPL